MTAFDDLVAAIGRAEAESLRARLGPPPPLSPEQRARLIPILRAAVRDDTAAA